MCDVLREAGDSASTDLLYRPGHGFPDRRIILRRLMAVHASAVHTAHIVRADRAQLPEAAEASAPRVLPDSAQAHAWAEQAAQAADAAALAEAVPAAAAAVALAADDPAAVAAVAAAVAVAADNIPKRRMKTACDQITCRFCVCISLR